MVLRKLASQMSCVALLPRKLFKLGRPESVCIQRLRTGGKTYAREALRIRSKSMGAHSVRDLVHRGRTSATLYSLERRTYSLETIPRKRLERAEALAAPDLWRP